MRTRLLLVVCLLGMATVASAQQMGRAQSVFVQDSGTQCSLGNACAVFTMTLGPSAVIGISGAWAGTQAFEASSDGSTWTAVPAVNTTTGTSATTATANGNYAISNPGWVQIRTRMTSYGSGTATVTAQGGFTAAPASLTISAVTIQTTSGGTLTATGTALDINCANCVPGATTTPASGASAVPVRPLAMTDGTNTMPTQDNVARPGFQKITDGTNTLADPCSFLTWTGIPISQATATAQVVISAVSAKKNYICALVLVAGAAEIINVIEGTGANCGSSQAAVAGSTTAANGLSFAANGGFVNPVKFSGIGTNTNTCILTSGANRVAGHLEYVQQ